MGNPLKSRNSSPARALIKSFGAGTIAHLLEGLVASALPVAVFDPEDRLVYSSDSFERLFVLDDGPQTFSSMIRKCHGTQQGPLIEADDIDVWLAGASKRRRSVPHRRFEIDFIDGRWFQAIETTYDNGWVLIVLIDLTAFKTKEADLTIARDAAVQEAETDFLTGVMSRRAIMGYLDTATRAATPRNPLTVALIDLDHFKQINDTLGHDVGDDVLKKLGEHLSSMFRDNDRIGRVGGEEFLLVMPGADTASAWLALQRLRRHWLSARAARLSSVHGTFSVGIAQWEAGQSASKIYRIADQALYQAKSGGRDKIICANGMLPQDGDFRSPGTGTLPATGTDN